MVANERKPPGQSPTDLPSAKPAPSDGSRPPNGDEWGTARETNIVGASDLGCEARRSGGWLRVACGGKSKSGGTPMWLRVKSGDDPGKVFTCDSYGTVTLTAAIGPGSEIEAEIGWSDASHRLWIKWPSGAVEPPTIGEFDRKRVGTVRECDDYFDLMERCSGAMPPEARKAMRDAVDTTRKNFETASATPEARAAVASACKQAADALRSNPVCSGK